MQRTALQNNKGYTLVEVMVAFVVLLFVTLATMELAMVSINANMKNVIRDEGVRIAEQTMNDARSAGYDGLVVGVSTASVPRNFRDIVGFTYTATTTVTQLGGADRSVDVRVNWTWKGESFNQTIATIMRQQ